MICTEEVLQMEIVKKVILPVVSVVLVYLHLTVLSVD